MLQIRMLMLRFWIWRATLKARMKDAMGVKTTPWEEFLIETWLM